MHSWRKTQDFGNTTAVHAFVKATLRLGLRAPFVARNDNDDDLKKNVAQKDTA